jgi:hypothetical protein
MTIGTAEENRATASALADFVRKTGA